MNKIVLEEYLHPDWCTLVLFCIQPSKELVEKWKPVLDYEGKHSHPIRRECLMGHPNYDPSLITIRNSNDYDETRDYTKRVILPRVKKEDQMQAAFLLESLEQCIHCNMREDGRDYAKIAIPAMRTDVNWELYVELTVELTYEI